MIGGNKYLTDLAYKCFRTIGYGLISSRSLYNTIFKTKKHGIILQKPNKIINTDIQQFKPINVGVGGKNKRKNIKTKKLYKKKSIKTRKN